MDMEKIIKLYVKNYNISQLRDLLNNCDYTAVINYYIGYYGNMDLLKCPLLDLRNKQEIIRGALESKFDNLDVIRYIDDTSSTKLKWQEITNIAALNGKLAVVQYGVTKFENNKESLRPVILSALINNHNNIVKYILSREKFDEDIRFRLLCHAVQKYNAEAFKCVLNAGKYDYQKVVNFCIEIDNKEFIEYVNMHHPVLAYS